MNMRPTINERMLDRSVKATRKQYDAMADTLRLPGKGQVIVSKRPKLPEERASKKKGQAGRKAVHGRIIAWQLRRLGHDAFDYPVNVRKEAGDYQRRNLARAMEKAFRTGRLQQKGVRLTLLGTAMLLAWFAAQRIRKGQLGMNKERYGKYKKRMQETGYALQKWGGRWPPYGILTGRFVGDRAGAPGIRAVHKSARRSSNRRPTRAPRDVYTR